MSYTGYSLKEVPITRVLFLSYDYSTKSTEIVYTFNRKEGFEFDNGFVVHKNNELLGLARSGGENTRFGNVFSFDLKQNRYRQLLNFKYSPDGSKPIGNLIEYKSYIYGITQEGGKNDQGTIYRIAVHDKAFEKLVDLSDYDIWYPSGGLALANDGKMVGFGGNTNPQSLPRIFYYHPEKNRIFKLVQFSAKTKLNELSIPQDNSVPLTEANRSSLYKLTDEPDSIDITLKAQEYDVLAVLTKNHQPRYPFDKPVGTPLIHGNKIYGLFDINYTPRNGGVFRFDV